MTSFKPYVQKLAKGQATFIYMTEEEAQNYSKALLAMDNSSKELGDSQVALGLFKDPTTKKYNLVTLSYNPLTKEAKVDKIEESSSLISHASNDFKRAAIRHKLF